MAFCNQPFEQIEIHDNGRVFTCCPSYINFYYIGNITEEPFDEIWNSQKAINLRKNILDGKFSLCGDICPRKANEMTNEFGYESVVKTPPKSILVSTDYTCNIECRFCRDEKIYKEYDIKNLEKEIESNYLPIFKGVEIAEFGVNGEPFASKKEKYLIKRIAQEYPDIKFSIHTNGILGDEKLLTELGIIDRLERICVSFHSASFLTYDKIIKGGNFYKVMDNLKLYSKLKRNKMLSTFEFYMCVFSENYKDMPNFVKLAIKYDALACFWGLRKTNSSYICRNFEKYNVINKSHPEFSELIKVLRDKIFFDPHSALAPELEKYKNYWG